jgi:hypothetical protein
MEFDELFESGERSEFPAEWKFRHVERDGLHETVTGPVEPAKSDEELLRKFGYDPADIELIGPISQWRKERKDGTFLVSYYFRHQSRRDRLDLPTLYSASRKRPRKPLVGRRAARTTVPVLADVQAGKTGSRGGTPELVDRLQETREKLTGLLKARRPEAIVLPEAGDLFEGFESGGNPMFTNDLSLAQQIDLAATEIYSFVELCARWGHVDVMAVPSNHTAWRRGKQNLGRPSDDLGLMTHRQVEKVANAAGLDVTWHYPAPYDESMMLRVRNTTIGLVHGNQFNQNGAVQWWTQQQHGGQPVGAADVLITGHYHALRVQPTGRNPYTGRAKWWLQAPTLDNGSDWFRNTAGEDSDPGLLVFDITDDGFDLQSLTIL